VEGALSVELRDVFGGERAAQGGRKIGRAVGAGCSCVSSVVSERVCVTKRWVDSERWRCWIVEGQVCALLADDDGQYQALSHSLGARTTRSLGGCELGRVQDRANNSPSALNARRKEYYTLSPDRGRDDGGSAVLPSQLWIRKRQDTRICCQLTLFQILAQCDGFELDIYYRIALSAAGAIGCTH
jgi:hypothetical protein